MKKFFITVLSLMMVLGLCACGAKEGGNGTVSANSSAKDKLFAFMTAQNDIVYDDVKVTGGGSETYGGEDYNYEVSYIHSKDGTYSFCISSEGYTIIAMTQVDKKVYTEFLGMKVVEDLTPETEALNVGSSLRKMSQVSEEGLDVYTENMEAETAENGETTIRFDLTEEGTKYLKNTLAVDDMIGLSENITDNSKIKMEVVYLPDMTVKKIYIECNNSKTDEVNSVNLTLNYENINGNNKVELSEPASSYIPWSDYEASLIESEEDTEDLNDSEAVVEEISEEDTVPEEPADSE